MAGPRTRPTGAADLTEEQANQVASICDTFAAELAAAEAAPPASAWDLDGVFQSAAEGMRGIDAGEQSTLGPLVASLDEAAEIFDELDGSIQAAIERIDPPTDLKLIVTTATEVYFDSAPRGGGF